MNSEILEIEPETKECEIQACNFCDLCFTNSIDLNIHIKDNHKDLLKNINNDTLSFKKEDKTYNCRTCGKIFDYKQNRWRHEQKCNLNIDEIFELKQEIKNLKDKLKIVLKINNQQSLESKTINMIKEKVNEEYKIIDL